MRSRTSAAQGYSYPLNGRWTSNLGYLHDADLENQYRTFQQANVDHPAYIDLKNQLNTIVTSHKKMLKAVKLEHARDNSVQQHKYYKLKSHDRLDYDAEQEKLQRELDTVATKELAKLDRKIGLMVFELDNNDRLKNWRTLQKIANAYDSTRTEMEITKINMQAKLDSHLYYLRAKELVRKSRRNQLRSDYYYGHYCAHHDWYTTWSTIAWTTLLVSAISRPSASSVSTSSMSGQDAGKGLAAIAIFLVLVAAIAIPAWGMYKLWQKANQEKIPEHAKIKKASMLTALFTSFVGLMVGGAFLPWAAMAAAVSFPAGGLIFFGILGAVAVSLALGCLGYAIGHAIAKISNTNPTLKADNNTNQAELNEMNKEFKQTVQDQESVLKPLHKHKTEIESGDAEFRQWPMWDKVPEPSAPPMKDVVGHESHQQQPTAPPVNDDPYAQPPSQEQRYG